MGKMKNAQLRKLKIHEESLKAQLLNLKIHEESLKALQDFTDESNWDGFYTITGSNDSSDWYAEWPELRVLLTENLSWKSSERPELQQPENARILVPGCGNSSLSGHLYDFGFRNVLNLDFSKAVITNMMRKSLRERPEMKWRVMDITALQFPHESFDAVLDKGLLDGLMQCIPNSRIGSVYLLEVKRVLAAGGKFICITLAEPHVIDLLLCKFRFGWKTSLHTIAQETNLEQQIFALVAEKDSPTSISQIWSFLDKFSVESHGDEARELLEALDKERKMRTKYDTGRDVVYSLEDLVFGAKGNISALEPGRRIELILGDPGVSYLSFRAILLDSKESEGFTHHYCVLIVPYLGARNWIYALEEGQWGAVISTKTARLLMVFMDSSNSIASPAEIEVDLDLLIQQLKPAHYDDTIQIPYMYAADGIRKRKTVYEVTSDLTGLIMVEDVTYEAMDEDGPCNGDKQRRLVFLRTKNLVQSEALLSRKAPSEAGKEAPKRKKKGKQRKYKSGPPGSCATSGPIKVVHNMLDSGYHNGIISGILLVSAYSLHFTSHGRDLVKTVVIGLGAGLLPMFMKNCLPSLKIKVVELDPVVLNVAREYFGFQEDEQLKVHIGDGIKFVKEMADSEAGKVADTGCENKQVTEEEKFSKADILVVDVDSSDLREYFGFQEDEQLKVHIGDGIKFVKGMADSAAGKVADTVCENKQVTEEESFSKVDILVVDVDSSDLSSGLTCPSADYVDESFLRAANESLSEQGVLIMNLITRSSSSRIGVYTRLKTVFSNVLRCDILEDVYEVIFALKTGSALNEEQLSEARNIVVKRLEQEKEWSKLILDIVKFIKPLR